MNKYQELLLFNMEQKWELWLEKQPGPIDGDEIRVFLHSVAGTAGSVGLPEISRVAASLLQQSQMENQNRWHAEQLRQYLLELITVTYAARHRLEETTVVDRDDGPGTLASDAPTVLVLDDDPAFLIYLKDALERQGYMALVAARPAQAVEYVHKYRPDAMILDLHIREESGFDTLRSLQDEWDSLFIPTTIVSQDDSKANRLEAYRLGADDYLVKPLDVEELCGRLSRQMRRKKTFDRARRHPETSQAGQLNEIEDTRPPHDPEGSASRPLAEAKGWTSVRAVVVDDDPVVRTMLQEYLKNCFPPQVPVDIRSFSDGEQFMNDAWSHESVPCFVILDRMMPKMDGIEVLLRLRQSENSVFYTVLMLTNKKSESDIVKALEIGADDYITKPFSLKELEARVRRLAARMA